MRVDTQHVDYEANLPAWTRARDVLSGEDRVKAARERYLPRLELQTDAEYAVYVQRASFFNGTARTAEGFLGLVFRRAPFIKLPDPAGPLGQRLGEFANDADLLGTPLARYAQDIVREVIAVGRAGTLIDWEGEVEQRVYVARYAAEDILNWRMARMNGRNMLSLLTLRERVGAGPGADAFDTLEREQLRVLRLVDTHKLGLEAIPAGPEDPALPGPRRGYACVVEIWAPAERGEKAAASTETQWKLVDRRIPLRRGKPLPLIPFVFHGPRHALPVVDKLPLADMIVVNLDHYRLDADYKHGMHYTALPTVWVSGFDKNSSLHIGGRTAWVTEKPGAQAGFLEYKGQGLGTFERAMDRDERLMALLGSRLLETQKRVGETAEAIELRQSGEDSILASLATSVSASLTQVLRWAYWWNSTEALPEEVTREQVTLELNTDFSAKGLTAAELQAIVASWQAKALSRDTMLDVLRRGEVLPEGRTNAEETQLIRDNEPVATGADGGAGA